MPRISVSRALGPLALAAALAACRGVPATAPRPHASVGPTGAIPSAAMVAAAGATLPPARPGVSPPTSTSAAPSVLAGRVVGPAGLISDHGGGLIGKVKGADVVSNNGAGVVSNNGAGLIGKVKLRLAGVQDQVPLANALVEVVDAAGQPVNGPDGQPLQTTTDADGHYTFAGVSAIAHNWVVQAPLADGTGAFRAIAPRQAAATDINLDLVSTLTTGYILDRYVRPQAADPTTVLDRLPSDIERDTRTKAANALGAGKVPVPDSLATTQVVATVEALRASDPALDQQMETVRRVLVAAGLMDLGDGQLAASVPLRGVGSLLPGPGGTLYFTSGGDGRLWRLDPDARLRAVATGGRETLGPAPSAPDGQFKGLLVSLGFDADGRLIFGEGGTAADPAGKVYREDGANQFTPLWQGSKTWVGGLLRRADGGLVGYSAGLGLPPALFPLAQGAAPLALSDDVRRLLTYAGRVGQAPDGTIYLVAGLPSGTQGDGTAGSSYSPDTLYELDLSAMSFKSLFASMPKDPAPSAIHELTVDRLGHVFARYGDGNVALVGPDGSRIQTFPAAAAELAGDTLDHAGPVLDAGGALVIASADGKHVVRVDATGKTVLAGPVEAASASDSYALALQTPSGIAPGADGTFYVGDAGLPRLVRVAADGHSTVVAGTNTKGAPGKGDGQLATSVDLSGVDHIRLDAQGEIFFAEASQAANMGSIRKVTPDGMLATAYTPDVPGVIPDPVLDYVVHPSGALDICRVPMLLVQGAPAFTVRVYHLEGGVVSHQDLDASIQAEYAQAHGDPTSCHLALDGHDVLYVLVNQRLVRLGADGSATLVKADPRLVAHGGMAFDARGRLYVANGGIVTRYDPSLDTFTVVAGTGSANFSGTDVDHSLDGVTGLAFDSAGNLLLLDAPHGQVKRVTADRL